LYGVAIVLNNSDWVKLSGKGVNPHMYAAITCDHEIPFEDVRRAINERGFQVAGSKLEDLDDIPPNVIFWMLFEHRKLGTTSIDTRYVRIASIEYRGPQKFFHTVNGPWWSTIYYTVVMWAMFQWEKAKFIYSCLRGQNNKKWPNDGIES
jgi:hypothetical protein